MAVALIFDSAKRIGAFGDYNITANSVSANTILLKGKDNKSYGKLSVEENSVSIFLLNDENQININPSNIEFLEIDDSTDKIILKIPKIKSILKNSFEIQNLDYYTHTLHYISY